MTGQGVGVSPALAGQKPGIQGYKEWGFLDREEGAAKPKVVLGVGAGS